VGRFLIFNKNKILILSVSIIISISITTNNYIIADSICNYIGVKYFTYYSFVYWCDITINILGLLLIILNTIYVVIFYNLLKMTNYDII